MRNVFGKLLADENGISSVEYALLLAAIAIGVATAAAALGPEVKRKMCTVVTQMNNAVTC
jgi:Flp pilus assembly pilin Flp